VAVEAQLSLVADSMARALVTRAAVPVGVGFVGHRMGQGGGIGCMGIMAAPTVDARERHPAMLLNEPGIRRVVTSFTEGRNALDEHSLVTAAVGLVTSAALALSEGLVHRRLPRPLPQGFVTAEAQLDAPVLEQRWMR
jgi:hypothetical protein